MWTNPKYLNELTIVKAIVGTLNWDIILMGSDVTHIYQVEFLAHHLVLLCLFQGFYVNCKAWILTQLKA
jgi:hypothetical protein